MLRVVGRNMKLNQSDIAITDRPVTIRVLEVNGQPMSASVFRQLPKRVLINRRGLKLNGEPIGRVNYFWGSCNSMHLHVLWLDTRGDLNRDCVYATRGKNEPPDHEWVEVFQSLQGLPQLYIEHTDTDREV